MSNSNYKQKTSGGVHRIRFLGLSSSNLVNTYTSGAGVSMGGRNNIAIKRALARRASLNRGTMENPSTGKCSGICIHRGGIQPPPGPSPPMQPFIPT